MLQLAIYLSKILALPGKRKPSLQPHSLTVKNFFYFFSTTLPKLPSKRQG